MKVIVYEKLNMVVDAIKEIATDSDVMHAIDALELIDGLLPLCEAEISDPAAGQEPDAQMEFALPWQAADSRKGKETCQEQE